MQELFDKILKLKPAGKVGVVLGAIAVLFGLYYVLIYVDLEDELSAAQGTRQELADEKQDYEKRKAEYLAFRQELEEMQNRQKELLKVLPRENELPAFIKSVNEQIEISGLETVKMAMDEEIPEDVFVKIPVRMEVRGGFHALGKFFRNLGELRRIVNIEDLSLEPQRRPAGRSSVAGPNRITARFTAAMFRFLSEEDRQEDVQRAVH